MATIREIAKRVGFSQATVSRVLKDDPTFSVKDSTREKILNASLEMGYKNVPQYQRITIPQDVAILDNVVPDKGLQDAYFDELREVLVKHAEEQRMNVTMHEDVDSLIADAEAAAAAKAAAEAKAREEIRAAAESEEAAKTAAATQTGIQAPETEKAAPGTETAATAQTQAAAPAESVPNPSPETQNSPARPADNEPDTRKKQPAS